MRLLRSFSLAASTVSCCALAAGCATPEKQKKEPLGYMPIAVTTAQPEWIPFRIRAGKQVTVDPRERHLADLRQLTFDGDNAESRWSPDGHELVYRARRGEGGCDQVFVMNLGSGESRRVSTGEGKATSGFFLFPEGKRLLFASTHAAGAVCPPMADRAQGHALSIDDEDIYGAGLDGGDLRPLIVGPGYDAGATVAFDGSRIAFTSTRDGDLDVYTAKPDGSDVRRVTNAPGYDGGAFFSPDATRLVWHASRPAGDALAAYKAQLEKKFVRPAELEIMVAGAEGQNARAVTKTGKSSFAPSFFPDSRRVIFASDADAVPRPGKAANVDLFVVDPDGPVGAADVPIAQRVTYDDGYDGSPMFSPDGEHIVFASGRFAATPGDANLFVARWVD